MAVEDRRQSCQDGPQIAHATRIWRREIGERTSVCEDMINIGYLFFFDYYKFITCHNQTIHITCALTPAPAAPRHRPGPRAVGPTLVVPATRAPGRPTDPPASGWCYWGRSRVSSGGYEGGGDANFFQICLFFTCTRAHRHTFFHSHSTLSFQSDSLSNDSSSPLPNNHRIDRPSRSPLRYRRRH